MGLMAWGGYGTDGGGGGRGFGTDGGGSLELMKGGGFGTDGEGAFGIDWGWAWD